MHSLLVVTKSLCGWLYQLSVVNVQHHDVVHCLLQQYSRGTLYPLHNYSKGT